MRNTILLNKTAQQYYLGPLTPILAFQLEKNDNQHQLIIPHRDEEKVLSLESSVIQKDIFYFTRYYVRGWENQLSTNPVVLHRWNFILNDSTVIIV